MNSWAGRAGSKTHLPSLLPLNSPRGSSLEFPGTSRFILKPSLLEKFTYQGPTAALADWATWTQVFACLTRGDG